VTTPAPACSDRRPPSPLWNQRQKGVDSEKTETALSFALRFAVPRIDHGVVLLDVGEGPADQHRLTEFLTGVSPFGSTQRTEKIDAMRQAGKWKSRVSWG
jgi:hypothetical protein